MTADSRLLEDGKEEIQSNGGQGPSGMVENYGCFQAQDGVAT